MPSISWRRADGSPFPGKMKINQSNGVLEIPYFQPEDAGFYECVAENSRGRNVAKGHLIFNGNYNLQIGNNRKKSTNLMTTINWILGAFV